MLLANAYCIHFCVDFLLGYFVSHQNYTAILWASGYSRHPKQFSDDILVTTGCPRMNISENSEFHVASESERNQYRTNQQTATFKN